MASRLIVNIYAQAIIIFFGVGFAVKGQLGSLGKGQGQTGGGVALLFIGGFQDITAIQQHRLKFVGGAVLRCGNAIESREKVSKEHCVLHLDGKGGGFAPVLYGDGLALDRFFGAKALTGHTGGGIVAFNGAGFIGALILHRENHAGQVEFGIALVVLRLCGSLGHRNALHLFQRHGLGAALVGSHFAGSGLISLLGGLGGVSIGVILQQLIGRSLGGRNLRLAVLEGERSTGGSHGEGHGDPLCSILLQRNGNAVGSRHGVVLIGHGHAAGFCGVTVTGHGIGIRCIGGRQRHGGGAGISAAVDFERSIRGSNGKGYRRGGGLPAEGGIVAGLGHEGAA